MGEDDAFQRSIRDQAFVGAREASVVIFLVDGRTGVTPDDLEVARVLKRSGKPILLTVNKLDTPGREDGIWEFYELGLGDPWPVSAVHGHGTGDLLDEVVNILREAPEPEGPDIDPGINIAIIGRPNAGKSSLANRLIGADRSIVSEVAGTTRDAVDTPVVHDGKPYTIVDTAGLRRKSQIDHDVEYYGYVRAMRAIDRADVALLVMDATLGLTDQDQRVAKYALERGCAMVVLLNKRDIVESGDSLNELRDQLAERLGFVGFAPIISISALTGKGVDRIWGAVDSVYAAYSSKLPTAKLNTWLEGIREFGHTIRQGKRVLKMKYVTQTRTCPPEITFFCNAPDLAQGNPNYQRFLENRLRQSFDLAGTPVRLKFKRKD